MIINFELLIVAGLFSFDITATLYVPSITFLPTEI